MLVEKLKGEWVQIWCCVYIYSGRLLDVDADHYLIEDPEVVYETGPLTSAKFTDSQPLPDKTWLVARTGHESIGRAPQRG